MVIADRLSGGEVESQDIKGQARQLAEQHADAGPVENAPQLLDELDSIERLLVQAQAVFSAEAEDQLLPGQAAEWVLDNYYVIRHALREIKFDLPEKYYLELPKLKQGELSRYPRVYALARELVSISRAQLEVDTVQLFVADYQQIAVLTMGEIWALPILLRFSIVETLAEVLAATLGAEIELARPPAVRPRPDLSTDTIVANCIISLRTLATADWKAFFEELSLVEQTLAEDPFGVYKQMDFDTRDRYRQVVEDLAKASGQLEAAVAEQAIHLARQANERRQPGETISRNRHVGFYLIDDGRIELEQQLHYRPDPLKRAHRWLFESHPAFTYLGGISLITIVLIVVMLAFAALSGATVIEQAGATLLALIPAVSVAVSLMNRLIPHLVPPRILPKMDFEEGIPGEFTTVVVIPALLSSEGDVDNLLHQLELHFLRNEDPNLYFALLTDFSDAPSKHMPEDQGFVSMARAGIKELNIRHRSKANKRPFCLFHRERLWNAGEETWMGWERKRGKLEEFNRLLLGEGETSFSVQDGNLKALAHARFVITLDADTILPRGSAHRLAGALAHPLNRPQFDPQTGRLVAGYTVLQPRTEIKPLSAIQTHFTRIFSGDRGIDLYTKAVSDVYQDLFGEGIYVGKGIYDVAAFLRSLEGRVPENALLSHDLFEGLQGRVGLVSDIILYEDYPPSYLVYAHRLHRWIRGDWQLLPWLLPTDLYQEHTKVSRLSLIDRWKIFDNLRRSMLTPALLAFLLAGWLWLPGSPLVWTAMAIIVPSIGAFTGLFTAILRQIPREITGDVGPTFERQTARWLLSLVFLPYEALVALDAAFTVLVRMFITHKRLLQWTTAAHTLRLLGHEQAVMIVWREMYGASLVALLLAPIIGYVNLTSFIVAAPLLLAWIWSPLVAYWLRRPVRRRREHLNQEQIQRLRILARCTWLYFEQFVGPEDHWLPPDHFQEDPRGTVAHRTSPTNIGLALLSTLAACDMGYIGIWDMCLRLQNTFETLARLERHRGHFLNWYDTRTLEPLPPRYVSTVDSGNLAACLLALRQGCLSLPQATLPRQKRWEGLRDTLDAFAEILARMVQEDGPAVSSLWEQLTAIRDRVRAEGADTGKQQALLEDLITTEWPRFERGLLQLAEAREFDFSTLRSIRLWSERVRHTLLDMKRRLDTLVPWPGYLAKPPAILATASPSTELGQSWQGLTESLPDQLPFGAIPAVGQEAQRHLEALRRLLLRPDVASYTPDQVTEALKWCADLGEELNRAMAAAEDILVRYDRLNQQMEDLVEQMGFSFLFDQKRRVLHIGYNVDAEKSDGNYYDLLASEARTTSLLGIGKGDLPVDHWLYLSRPMARLNGRRTLLSWSGTMFEYLMPILFTKQYEGTLLDASLDAAIQHQIDYVHDKDVPWGISESGYYRFDGLMNYQYKAFGVPGLGLKRGLEDDLVITPYASLLALPLRPEAVMRNVERLTKLGMLGDYGFYEAVDYTPARLGLGQDHAIIRSFMVHHQGMIMLTLANVLQDQAIVRRFHADPRVESAELLLQEQIPERLPVETEAEEESVPMRMAEPEVTAQPWQVPAQTPAPRIHCLSNGRYRLLISNAGGGFSAWQETDLTRWRADSTCDDWGTWIYLKDLDNGQLRSASTQPLGGDPGRWEVSFAPHRVDFRSTDDELVSHLQITVPPEDDVEVRRIRLTNHGSQRRRLFLASYGEVILETQEADQRHPAFNKLFIESEYLPESNLLLFRRRPRSAEESSPYLVHMLVTQARQSTTGDYETSRDRFLGRGGSTRYPAALDQGRPHFSGSTGTVLDPIFSLGQEIELGAHSSIEVVFLTAAAGSRPEALQLAKRYSDWSRIRRAFNQARARSESEMVQLELDTDAIALDQRLLSWLIYPHSALRASPETLAANQLGQSGLWPHAISGDYPILMFRIRSEDGLGLLRQLLQAHTYWRRSGLKIDLVIMNEKETGYDQVLRGQIRRLIARMNSEDQLNQRGGIFIVQADALEEAERILLATAARVILDEENGSLAQQIAAIPEPSAPLPVLVAERRPRETDLPPLPRPEALRFDNGWGGFSPDGREYLIYLKPGETTPAPWVNVVANDQFGFLISESGSGYTWAVNSGENRLTPWRNDPVSDPPSEALYLRDEETADVWSPTPGPAPADAPYLIRHGAGYSIFEHHSHGLKQRLRLFADRHEPVKIVHLQLENTWDRPRRITATYYAEWVLGVHRDAMQQYVVPEYDYESQGLLASNPYNAEFGQRVAFLAASREPHGLTADRAEFLGRLGDTASPVALSRVGLAGTIRPGLDPCAALQIHLDLAPYETRHIHFLVGQGADRAETIQLISRFREPEAIEGAWQEISRFWDELLDTITVQTPDQAMDLMLNRWLLYQDLSCRIWGRSALYQSSGAYGFRDQLQDVLAVVHAAPDIAREHILRSARHQFEAGDVLHWWHPPSGRGVRTRISDDLLWLPYAVAHYVRVTGDKSILAEEIPFLKGAPLAEDEDERYGYYEETEEAHTLYNHCRRALSKAHTIGDHHLPLMGAGDWNDGMNRVGKNGRGESVWLGWFLYAVMSDFLAVCEIMNDEAEAGQLRQRMDHLRQALEKQAWDGDWYLRAFYDDGAPLGSYLNRECQIDSIAQSWAVISGAGRSDRAKQAMASVYERLVRQDERLILLFTPPFDATNRDPGYIKGYPPGIRENGGQYTHAAIWVAWAYAQLGQGDRAEALFRLLNPIYHNNDPAKNSRYKVEPYVVASDVYSVRPYVGHGGWTWYTGSAGWLYRLGLEAILGLRQEGDSLTLAPQIPDSWQEYQLNYCRNGTSYHIQVKNSGRQGSQRLQVTVDGQERPDGRIPLLDDGHRHEVTVHLLPPDQ
ncbi:MAG: GH36-type glycosyl hydrolase domain-containing protein [Candidatus Promineifilaceae bacterium]